MTRREDVFARIDAANGEDPNRILVDGREEPAEQAYGERMSAMLGAHHPEASEALQIAARAQHLKRWTVARDAYPMTRSGYHRWRNEAKRLHAQWTGEIMRACGYSDAEIARVGALIRKENLKHDADAQALEDTACLVFLAHYADAFISKHDDAKVVEILKKTWAKMSDEARAAALALPHSERLTALLGRALAGADAKAS